MILSILGILACLAVGGAVSMFLGALLAKRAESDTIAIDRLMDEEERNRGIYYEARKRAAQ